MPSVQHRNLYLIKACLASTGLDSMLYQLARDMILTARMLGWTEEKLSEHIPASDLYVLSGN